MTQTYHRMNNPTTAKVYHSLIVNKVQELIPVQTTHLTMHNLGFQSDSHITEAAAVDSSILQALSSLLSTHQPSPFSFPYLPSFSAPKKKKVVVKRRHRSAAFPNDFFSSVETLSAHEYDEDILEDDGFAKLNKSNIERHVNRTANTATPTFLPTPKAPTATTHSRKLTKNSQATASINQSRQQPSPYTLYNEPQRQLSDTSPAATTSQRRLYNIISTSSNRKLSSWGTAATAGVDASPTNLSHTESFEGLYDISQSITREKPPHISSSSLTHAKPPLASKDNQSECRHQHQLQKKSDERCGGGIHSLTQSKELVSMMNTACFKTEGECSPIKETPPTTVPSGQTISRSSSSSCQKDQSVRLLPQIFRQPTPLQQSYNSLQRQSNQMPITTQETGGKQQIIIRRVLRSSENKRGIRNPLRPLSQERNYEQNTDNIEATSSVWKNDALTGSNHSKRRTTSLHNQPTHVYQQQEVLWTSSSSENQLQDVELPKQQQIHTETDRDLLEFSFNKFNEDDTTSLVIIPSNKEQQQQQQQQQPLKLSRFDRNIQVASAKTHLLSSKLNVLLGCKNNANKENYMGGSKENVFPLGKEQQQQHQSKRVQTITQSSLNRLVDIISYTNIRPTALLNKDSVILQAKCGAAAEDVSDKGWALHNGKSGEVSFEEGWVKTTTTVPKKRIQLTWKRQVISTAAAKAANGHDEIHLHY